MSNNVLIGLPAGADSLWKSQSLDLIKNAIPDVGDVFATNEALLFRSALLEDNFAVAVCFENAGINRILFTRDVNNESIRKMVTDGYASESELLEYLGMFQRPVKVEQSVEKSEPDPGTKVEKKYMGNGVLVTRLCGCDVKKLTGDGIGEDEILSAIISNNYNIRLDMASMPYKEFELDDAWIAS